MKVAIIQPSFIPWKGFFDIISKVDIFVHLDDVQYTKSDWRNRNYISGRNGRVLLTIPIRKHPFGSKINQIYIDEEKSWRKLHLKTIKQNYSNSPFYKDYESLVEDIYSFDTEKLSEFTIYSVELISRFLGLKTKFTKSSEFVLNGSRETKLIEICKLLDASEYITGPAASSYLNPGLWLSEGIKLRFFSYEYPEYPQKSLEFHHNVSIIDLLFNVGIETKNYMDSLRKDDNF